MILITGPLELVIRLVIAIVIEKTAEGVRRNFDCHGAKNLVMDKNVASLARKYVGVRL